MLFVFFFLPTFFFASENRGKSRARAHEFVDPNFSRLKKAPSRSGLVLVSSSRATSPKVARNSSEGLRKTEGGKSGQDSGQLKCRPM